MGRLGTTPNGNVIDADLAFDCKLITEEERNMAIRNYKGGFTTEMLALKKVHIICKRCEKPSVIEVFVYGEVIHEVSQKCECGRYCHINGAAMKVPWLFDQYCEKIIKIHDGEITDIQICKNIGEASHQFMPFANIQFKEV